MSVAMVVEKPLERRRFWQGAARPCTRCQQMFDPTGPRHRYCDRCQRRLYVVWRIRNAAKTAEQARMPDVAAHLYALAARLIAPKAPKA